MQTQQWRKPLLYLAGILTALCNFSLLAAGTPDFKIQQLTDDLERPWSLAVMPDQQLLITEKSGQLIRFDNGSLTEIEGLPDVYDAGQGGLLDVKLHPDFASNNRVYLSYSAGNRFSNRLQLLMAELSGNRLINQQILFSAAPDKDTALHYAGRIAFLPDNTLLLSIGDGYAYLDQAQEKDSLLGKIVRLHDDGSIPADNPFVNESGSRSEIYSYGHRNTQGLFYDPQRKLVFANEHGPKGGDEINIIHPGNNYGWPVITYGVDYSGLSITPHREYPGMEQPLVDWTPSIAPSSLLVYQGDMFPELQGDILSTTLKARHLRRVEMQGNTPGQQSELLSGLNERLRYIEEASDGSLYVLTDSGKLLHLTN